jgi:hypothetical protein
LQKQHEQSRTSRNASQTKKGKQTASKAEKSKKQNSTNRTSKAEKQNKNSSCMNVDPLEIPLDLLISTLNSTLICTRVFKQNNIQAKQSDRTKISLA